MGMLDPNYYGGAAGAFHRRQGAAYGNALRILNRAARRGDKNSALAALDVYKDADANGFSPGGIQSYSEKLGASRGYVRGKAQAAADMAQRDALDRKRMADAMNPPTTATAGTTTAPRDSYTPGTSAIAQGPPSPVAPTTPLVQPPAAAQPRINRLTGKPFGWLPIDDQTAVAGDAVSSFTDEDRAKLANASQTYGSEPIKSILGRYVDEVSPLFPKKRSRLDDLRDSASTLEPAVAQQPRVSAGAEAILSRNRPRTSSGTPVATATPQTIPGEATGDSVRKAMGNQFSRNWKAAKALTNVAATPVRMVAKAESRFRNKFYKPIVGFAKGLTGL